MINMTELTNNIIQAMAEFQTAQDMYNELKSNMVPLTVNTVDTMLKRIGKTVEPLVNIIQNIYDTDPELGKGILSYGYGNKIEYANKPHYYATFQIEDVHGELIPVFKNHDYSYRYYRFVCSAEGANTIRYGYNDQSIISDLPYIQVERYVLEGFEAATYKAVEKYVNGVVKCLKNRTENRIQEANKLTTILKQVAGDEEANTILCQNIHVGNGIRSVFMTKKGIVVDICGAEYMLNVSKLPLNDDDDDDDTSWLS